jgi:hypothetical protein
MKRTDEEEDSVCGRKVRRMLTRAHRLPAPGATLQEDTLALGRKHAEYAHAN